MTHDLVIRNARISDGLGNPLVEGDIGIKNGRVTAIGSVIGHTKASFDAAGQVLAPGVVDVHTHYDAQLTWDPTASPSPALGVTSIVIGNCGFGIAPAPPEMRHTLLENLSEVEGMSLDSLEAGMDWGFQSFPEYLDFLTLKGVYPNVAALASHATIRTVVLGEESSKRTATPKEIDTMTTIFRESMEAGAIGLGSSTNENHRGFGGIPIASRLADQAEFDAFADIMAEFNHGVFLITASANTKIDFMERFAERSGRPSLYAAHFHYGQEPDRGRRLMEGAEAARQRGNLVYTQGSCQPLSLAFTLDSAYILKAIEPWPASEDHDALRVVFNDPEWRRRFRETLRVPQAGRTFNGRWDWVIVTRTTREENKALEGQSVQAIADRRAQDPLDVFLDLALAENFETFYTFYILNMDEDGVEELITNDGTLVSLSDAGAHNSLLCDAAYAMHLLSHWVRERPVFDLPTAIRKVTHDPANIYGLIDRGQLTEGAFADMMLFDPDRLTVSGMERHFDLPANGERLLRRAPGLLGTWVNGVQVFDGNDYCRLDHGPGRILSRFSSDRPTLGVPKVNSPVGTVGTGGTEAAD